MFAAVVAKSTIPNVNVHWIVDWGRRKFVVQHWKMERKCGVPMEVALRSVRVIDLEERQYHKGGLFS